MTLRPCVRAGLLPDYQSQWAQLRYLRDSHHWQDFLHSPVATLWPVPADRGPAVRPAGTLWNGHCLESKHQKWSQKGSHNVSQDRKRRVINFCTGFTSLTSAFRVVLQDSCRFWTFQEWPSGSFGPRARRPLVCLGHAGPIYKANINEHLKMLDPTRLDVGSTTNCHNLSKPFPTVGFNRFHSFPARGLPQLKGRDVDLLE